jgi:GT2 family glycosyltransferase
LSEKSKESKISVVVVNWFSYDLLSRLLDNLTAKAASADRLQYFIVDNTNGADRKLEQLKNRHDRVRIDPIDCRNLKGSWAHALGLNYATTRVDTSYSLVVDPDIHVFKKNWDEFLISELKKKRAVAIGAPYPSWKLGKYHNFSKPPLYIL